MREKVNWKEYHKQLGCYECKVANKKYVGKQPCCLSRKTFLLPAGNEPCIGLEK